ncbi:hypothetical protein D4M24_12225 [Escherichia coli]|nr:hypothetical protein D4M24_12225 [Escherichia coli]
MNGKGSSARPSLTVSGICLVWSPGWRRTPQEPGKGPRWSRRRVYARFLDARPIHGGQSQRGEDPEQELTDRWVVEQMCHR